MIVINQRGSGPQYGPLLSQMPVEILRFRKTMPGEIVRCCKQTGTADRGSNRPSPADRWPSVRRQLLPKSNVRTILRQPIGTPAISLIQSARTPSRKPQPLSAPATGENCVVDPAGRCVRRREPAHPDPRTISTSRSKNSGSATSGSRASETIGVTPRLSSTSSCTTSGRTKKMNDRGRRFA